MARRPAYQMISDRGNRGPRRAEREREKGPKKVFEKITAENFPNMKKENSQPCPGGTEYQAGYTKEKHTETHSNQTDKN